MVGSVNNSMLFRACPIYQHCFRVYNFHIPEPFRLDIRSASAAGRIGGNYDQEILNAKGAYGEGSSEDFKDHWYFNTDSLGNKMSGTVHSDEICGRYSGHSYSYLMKL